METMQFTCPGPTGGQPPVRGEAHVWRDPEYRATFDFGRERGAGPVLIDADPERPWIVALRDDLTSEYGSFVGDHEFSRHVSRDDAIRFVVADGWRRLAGGHV